METKICSKCKIEKEFNEFYFNKNTNRNRSICKICFNLNAKVYRNSKKEKIKEYSKNYRLINSEIIKEKSKNYREENKEQLKIRQKINSKKYYNNNSELMKERSKNFRENNPNYSYEYRTKNQSYSNDYQKKRRKEDDLFKLTYNVKSRLNLFIKKTNIRKTSSTFEMIGCTPQFLKEHLEMNFKEGMSWENYGLYGWHIDHIIPLSSAEDEDGVYKLCHYTNLQPLWAKENLSKGSKIINM